MAKNTVFIVDDNEAVCESLQWLLSSIDIPVEIFFSAEEFLNACSMGMWGCLVLDLYLPRMDGIALLKELRERKIQLPVIIVSGRTEKLSSLYTSYASIVAAFKKPANPDKLLAAIQQVLCSVST